MLHIFRGLVSVFSSKHPKWVRCERAACWNAEDSPAASQPTPLALIDLLNNRIPLQLANVYLCLQRVATCWWFLSRWISAAAGWKMAACLCFHDVDLCCVLPTNLWVSGLSHLWIQTNTVRSAFWKQRCRLFAAVQLLGRHLKIKKLLFAFQFQLLFPFDCQDPDY